jgi:hypothetical protein
MFVALLPGGLALATEAAARRFRARGERLYRTIIEEWARDSGKTPEEVAGRLEELKDDAAASDAIWRSVRALMDTPNSNAAVSLGVLTAEYLRDERPADAFFRGIVRLLSDLAEDEAAEMRRMLGWALEQTRRPRFDLWASDFAEWKGGKSRRVPWFVAVRPDDPLAPEEADGGNWIQLPQPPASAGRLFALLKASGVGLEAAVDVMGPGIFGGMDRPVAERLVRILDLGSRP